jgi:hypothetical protein
MSHDEIDRALREDETIEPSSDFTARVMRAVHEEVEDLGAIRFPWSRMVPGLVVCVLGLIATVFVAPPPAEPGLLDPRVVESALDKVFEVLPAQIMIAALAPLLGSWILVRLALRVCGYQR